MVCIVFTMADENSPAFLPGFFEVIEACAKDVPKITDAFRSGKGVLARARRMSICRHRALLRPNYRAHLIREWIPALGDTEIKLKVGATVADVGCGLGTSTVLMAQAYPRPSSPYQFSRSPVCLQRLASRLSCLVSSLLASCESIELIGERASLVPARDAMTSTF